MMKHFVLKKATSVKHVTTRKKPDAISNTVLTLFLSNHRGTIPQDGPIVALLDCRYDAVCVCVYVLRLAFSSGVCSVFNEGFTEPQIRGPRTVQSCCNEMLVSAAHRERRMYRANTGLLQGCRVTACVIDHNTILGSLVEVM